MRLFHPLLHSIQCAVLGLALLHGLPALQAASSLQATDLRVCDKTYAIGTEATPSFGWVPADASRNTSQTHYRIEVASSPEQLRKGSPDVWDSGVVQSNRVNAIPYTGPELKSDTRYFWRVTLTDQNGQSEAPRQISYFDVGLKENSDWTGAQWIRRESKEENDYTLYRKGFSASSVPIARAILYISSCHKYEVWLNNQLVGKGPAYHQPQFQYFNAYDVTKLLLPGAENALAVFNRWWGSGQGRPGAARGLIAKLVIHHADGSTSTVNTDGTWKQRSAEQWEQGTAKRNRTNGIGYIEKIHADKIIEGWQKPGFDDSSWLTATVVGPQPSSPWTGILQPDLTRVFEQEHVPATWLKHPDGHFLIDFGKVRPGYPRIDFTETGTPATIEILGGYTLLPTNRINTFTNQKTDLSFVFHHDGKAHRFQSVEYLGMRYLEVKNLPANIKPEAIRFVSRHYELELLNQGRGATFSSSNQQLDRVWNLMVDSIPVGTQEQFIDTPTREKGGFLNDAWSESVAAMLVARDRTMTRRVLEEYLDSQDAFWSKEGALNDVYPYGNKEDIPDYTQAYLVWVWDYFLETGDEAFLRKHYARLEKIMAYVLRSQRQETGLIHELTGGMGDYLHGIIDWPKSMRYGYDLNVSANTVTNAYAWLDLKIMAKIANVCEHLSEQSEYEAKAEKLKEAINRHLRTPKGLYADGLKIGGGLSMHLSQQANMMPLAFGIVPEEQRKTVLAHVKELRMSSGMVTVRWLLEAIGEMGDGEHLVELFTNKEWDGWSKCLERGATCTWESWNAIDGNESLSHGWGAIGVVAYVRYILGVTPMEPQHARMRIRPLLFGNKLTQASGRLPTERGDLYVAWKREDKRFQMTLKVPTAMSVQALVPAPQGATLKANGKVITAKREADYLSVNLGPGDYLLEAQ